MLVNSYYRLLMKKQKSPSAILLGTVEKFLSDNDMPATVFGLKAAKDPKLVFELRDGRELRWVNAQKVEKFMETYA